MTPVVDRRFQIAWSALGMAWVALVYHLFQLWGVSPDYSDRYIILLGSAGLIYYGRPTFEAVPVRPVTWARPF